MKILIPTTLIKAIPCFKEEPFAARFKEYHWMNSAVFNLKDYSEDALKRLRAAVQETKGLKGSRKFVADLDVWLATLQDPLYINSLKIKTLETVPEVFYLRMENMPRKHLYHKIKDGDTERWVVPKRKTAASARGACWVESNTIPRTLPTPPS